MIRNSLILIFILSFVWFSCTDDDKELEKVQPVIENFTPTSGPSGTIVNIHGMNLNLDGEETNILFGSNVVEINSLSSQNIEIVIPKGYDEESHFFKIKNNNSETGYIESLEKFDVVVTELIDFTPKMDTFGGLVSVIGKNFGNADKKLFLVEDNGDKHEMSINSVSDTLITATINIFHGAEKFKLLADIGGNEFEFSELFTVSPRFDFNDTIPIDIISTPILNIHVFTLYTDIKFTLGGKEIEGWSVPENHYYRIYRIRIPEGLAQEHMKLREA